MIQIHFDVDDNLLFPYIFKDVTLTDWIRGVKLEKTIDVCLLDDYIYEFTCSIPSSASLVDTGFSYMPNENSTIKPFSYDLPSEEKIAAIRDGLEAEAVFDVNDTLLVLRHMFCVATHARGASEETIKTIVDDVPREGKELYLCPRIEEDDLDGLFLRWHRCETIKDARKVVLDHLNFWRLKHGLPFIKVTDKVGVPFRAMSPITQAEQNKAYKKFKAMEAALLDEIEDEKTADPWDDAETIERRYLHRQEMRKLNKLIADIQELTNRLKALPHNQSEE